MIAWGIIWIILLAIITLLILQEVINGTIEIRFWIIILLIFALILVPICTIGRYNQSKQFYQNYTQFQSIVAQLEPDQEYGYLGEAMNYNNYLHNYKISIEKWGIFAPYYSGIKDLEPIQLQSYDMSKYIWG